VDTTLADRLLGTVLERRYRVEAVLAHGGMSTVYAGTDLRLERTVAIKVMSPSLAESPAFVQKFIREARSAAALSHPNVVAVFDQGADAGHVFLVMELVRGRTLREDLVRTGPLPPALALTVTEAVLSALAAAHRAGLVHRDVKPENVLVSPEGAVKVADFGLARAIASASATTQTGVLMGTVAYVAPEQVTRGAADARSDVYSTGIMLYELLTGSLPYAGDTAISVAYRHVHDDVPPPSHTNPNLAPALDELVVRATRREPGARPADAGAFLAELLNTRADLGLARVPVPGRTGAAVHPPHQAPPYSIVTTRPEPLRPRPRPAQPGPPLARPAPVRPATPRPAPTWSPPPGGEQRRYKRRQRTGLAFVLVLGLLAAGIGWWYGAGRWSTVPRVSGLARDQAVTALRDSGLEVSVATNPVYDDTAPAGSAARTDPPGGRRATHGTRITLFLSKGPAPRILPVVRGGDKGTVVADLRSRGLVVVARAGYDEDVGSGQVIGTDPAAGTSVGKGAQVVVFVSIGPAPRTVPALGGRSPDDALAALQNLQLNAETGARAEFSDDVAAGKVVRTEPAAGQKVRRGGTVKLILSKGPELVSVPDVVDRPLNEAIQILKDKGLNPDVTSLFGQRTGRVLAQSPMPGQRVRKGATVTIGVV
jgi:eukaryotic-like serine/threonine-protein kinase